MTTDAERMTPTPERIAEIRDLYAELKAANYDAKRILDSSRSMMMKPEAYCRALSGFRRLPALLAAHDALAARLAEAEAREKRLRDALDYASDYCQCTCGHPACKKCKAWTVVQEATTPAP